MNELQRLYNLEFELEKAAISNCAYLKRNLTIYERKFYVNKLKDTFEDLRETRRQISVLEKQMLLGLGDLL